MSAQDAPQQDRQQPGGQRLAGLHPATLDPDQRALYQEITGGPRAQGPQAFSLVDHEGRLEGPFNAMLLNPALGSALQATGAVIRYRGALSDRAREIAILVVAGHWRSEFETYAHRRVGRRAGLDDPTMDDVGAGVLDRLTGEDLVVATTCLALCRTNDLDDATYDAALAGLGQATLFELIGLVGYYASLALLLRVYRVAAPAD